MLKVKSLWVAVLGMCWLHAGQVASLAQIGWTESPQNPVFDVGPEGSWDSGIVFEPSVIDAGDTLKMWYAGADQGVAFARPEIGYAWSLDGVSWTREAGPVRLQRGGAWDAGQVENPVVIQDGDTLRMWYSGFGDGIAGESANKIGYAISTDGLNWTAHSDPVLTIGAGGEWDDATIVPASVVKVGSTYLLYYSAGEGIVATSADAESAMSVSTGIVLMVGLATSEDGINWTKYDDPVTHAQPFRDSDPIMKPGGTGSWDDLQINRPSVTSSEDGFQMWYWAKAATGPGAMGYATSFDGLAWEKHDGNPVFEVSSVWAASASDPTVVQMGDTYRMWFTGWPSEFPFHASIGSATAPASSVTGVVERTISSEPLGFSLRQNHPNPFNPRTRVPFELKTDAKVELQIFDLMGREVRRLLDADLNAGLYTIEWDGVNEAGRAVASGVYIYRLRVAGRSLVRRMTLLR